MKKLILFALLVGLVGNPVSLAWMAGWLVVDDGLAPADAVISLRGSHQEERQRVEEAARLVREDYGPILLISADGKPYYGQSVPKLVESYLKQAGFPEDRLRFCENRADYTAEEARFLLACLQELGAQQAIIVTSEYHTRRTRFLFRRAFAGSGVEPRVHPVYNSEYWDPHWWRRRRWAKTFLIESLSLLWSFTEEGLAVLFWQGAEKPRATVP